LVNNKSFKRFLKCHKIIYIISKRLDLNVVVFAQNGKVRKKCQTIMIFVKIVTRNTKNKLKVEFYE